MAADYSTQPHAAPIPGSRPKFREAEITPVSGGILIAGLLSDPRVMKGSSYATKGGQTKARLQTVAPSPGRRAKASRGKWIESRAPTPPPAEGRTHCLLQTDEYIEVLQNNAGSVQQTQTSSFTDRPSDPLFNRLKFGRDLDTQVENGDIFAFDIEVEPVLEVLLRNTLRSAMLELLQEEELEAIDRERETHLAERNAELAEVQRLEQEKRRLADEKGRREEQAVKRAREQAELKERLAARKVAYSALDELRELAFRTMEDAGILFDPLQKEIEDEYMPELLRQVVDRTAAFKAAEDNLAAIVMDAKVKALYVEADAVISKIAAEDAAKDAADLDVCCKLAAVFSLLNSKSHRGTTAIAVQGLEEVFASNPFILASLGLSAELALPNLLDGAVEEETAKLPTAEINEEESSNPVQEEPSPSPPVEEEMQIATPSRVIEREAFILALMYLACAQVPKTSTPTATTLPPPPPSLPAWPASREYEERLKAYRSSRHTLPSPIDNAPIFNAEVSLAEILETVCGVDPKPRSFWLATLKDFPLLSIRFGVPEILCSKTQEDFNSVFASFAAALEDAVPDEDGNPPPETIISIDDVISFFSTSWVAPTLDGEVPAVAPE